MSKPDKHYRKRKIGEHTLKPESLVMGYGFDPDPHVGKPPESPDEHPGDPPGGRRKRA